ncbi:MAG TPA: hypothetical protein VHS31_08585, partial [Tepidisphaeraceae bacterium]|nr:hypothetical protein [Tepidisphaeraceae bacterium]
RFLVEKQLNELTYSWDGSPDLKKFHSRSAFANTDLRDPENARQAWGMQTTFNNDRIALTPSASSKPFNFAPPPKYIPGGWLPFLLAKLPNHPMILRTDSFMDLAYAQPTDLFTVTIRPQPDTSRDTDDADSSQPLHCVQIEFSGTGETSRWFFRPDGTLDGIDYSQAQHLARRDEKEISTDFSRTPQLIP